MAPEHTCGVEARRYMTSKALPLIPRTLHDMTVMLTCLNLLLLLLRVCK